MPGDDQFLTRYGFATADVPALSITYRQSYLSNPRGRWIESPGRVTIDLCRESPGLCPIRAGNFAIAGRALNPINPFSPHGMYRSLQSLHDPAGNLLGCVRIDVPYAP